MKIRKTWKRLLSVLLTVSIVITTIAPSTAVSAAENSSTEISVSTQDDDNTPQTTVSSDDVETSNADKTDDAQDTSKASLEQSQSQQADNDKTEGASTKAATDTNLYQNGSICIYNEQQLKAVGTGTQVYEGDASADTFGTGAVLTDEEGNTLTYAADGSYTLMNDIPLTKESIWTLPEGFAGSFQGAEITAEKPLYDAETDTIYVYNNYQLATINDPDAIKTVMSNDMIASEFGVGQVVYTDEEKKTQLEYTADHNYVLSKDFTEQMPEMKAAQVQAESTVQLGGRDYIGQVCKEINGENYILIGNEQQLRAIGTETYVAPLLFRRVWKGIGHYEYQPYYPGDADLNLNSVSEIGITEEELEVAFDGNTFSNTGTLLNWNGISEGNLGAGMTTDYYVITVDSNGNKQLTRDIDVSTYKDLIYSSSQNYIIFRDIKIDGTLTDGYGDGNSDSWKPLMFNGKMEGRLNMKENSQVTLSNINVIQKEPLNTAETIGIGFFGTISNTASDQDIGVSGGAAQVKNIKLQNITVTNSVKTVKETTTVVEELVTVVTGLLGIVGGLLDIIVGGLGAILGGLTGNTNIFGDLSLEELLTKLLDYKAKAPDTFATGTFAGRIIGEVEVTGCNVVQGTVSNTGLMTGGFVGHVEGFTEYKGLGEILDGTVGLLEAVLNVIPGLGLGELVQLLLDNPSLLTVKNLVPTGYKPAKISNCHVSLKGTEIGNNNSANNDNDSNDKNSNSNFVGGFAGAVTGSKVENSSVSGLSKVIAQKYSGGFSGITRDATVKGVLSELGAKLVQINASSEITGCKVEGSSLQIKSEQNYAGGFTGAIANSLITTSSVSNLATVEAENYAGGFTGRATVGYISVLGETDEAKGSLLNDVKKLLGSVTAGNVNADILNLAGIQPSKLDGCEVSGTDFTVQAKENYAGGFFAQTDGVVMEGTTQSKITGIQQVSAKSYAGGISGKAATANAVGVLNNTIGLGNMLPFSAKNIELSGGTNGFSVEAEENYAGGAFGQAIGGNVDLVTLKNISNVQSKKNYAGGFIGDAGTGSLVDGGGLNLLGLNLAKIDNLLSLAEAVVLNISNSNVVGAEENGLSVSATGVNSQGSIEEFVAGGFIGESKSVVIENSKVTNLKSVTADATYGYAGGFTGTSETGGLAGVVQEGENKLPGIVDIDGLLGVVPCLIPEYKNCTVTYVSNNNKAQINAAVAGGFIADMQSGTIDNTGIEDHIAVYNLENVTGTYYAGGFAGRATSGGLASAGGLSLLEGLFDIDITNLLSLLETYIPVINNASVSSVEDGFVVSAKQEDKESSLDAVGNSGSAGGFIGYGSGVQISSCDVNKLKNTNVTPPTDLEAQDGSSYFGENSTYAVTAARYAGGFIGKMDIGSAAAVGSGLSLLEKIDLSNVLSALSVVTSTIEQSNVFGAIGGYSVLANNGDDQNPLGNAGGFAGSIYGGHVQYSHANNFEYVIGQETAGGYVGNMEPGDVAKVLGATDILDGLLKVSNSLLSLAQTFVPTIRNSYTTCVPCGGVVRANAPSTNLLQKGMAGGYVGCNSGGQIWGNSSDKWKEEATYSGEKAECAVKRLRSVYGYEYAGGFSGRMECASTASGGSLSLLYGLINVGNVLEVLQAIYPTDRNTAVYGPLRELDKDTWNSWVTAVGNKKAYADELQKIGTVNTDEELKDAIEKYAYGYNVVAGRDTLVLKNESVSEGNTKENTSELKASGGSAGGYAGVMIGGIITSANAKDVKEVSAMRAAGGFIGEMLAGGAAQIGDVSIAGLLSIDSNLIGALQTFVPVIKTSSVVGYQDGVKITATGDANDIALGYAGGYVGHMIGGQIQGEKIEGTDTTEEVVNYCIIDNLRSVDATNAAGGFAGKIDPGSVANVNTNAAGGAIGTIINTLIKTPASLLSVLNAVVSKINYAKVSAWNEYGIVVNAGKDSKAAGGFAGAIQGAVLGDENETAGLQVDRIRSVTGGEHAGGFFGLADVAAVAEVSGEGNTTILSLIKAGSIDLIDAFRTYVYNADVIGSKDGLTVTASKGEQQGSGESIVYTGNAGGFGGSLLNGSVKGSSVTNLKSVKAPNYTGGFIGHGGKSGTVDADGIGIDQLLELDAGVLDIFGSHIDNCSVAGLEEGYTVQSTNGTEEIAGGFIGNADLSRMSTNTAEKLKQVYSDEIAGGFVGKTSMAYLVSVNVDSPLVNSILVAVNVLLQKVLYADELQDINLAEIEISGVLDLKLLSDEKTLSLTVLGIPITVALSEKTGENETDVAIITIGDSKIELPCTKEGITNTDSAKDKIAQAGGVKIELIKANRTKIEKSTVTGISVGYDVFGGGASNDKDGISDKGYAGGFAGYNHAGLLEENHMIKADTVRGTANKIGEFSGYTNTDTSYDALKDPTNIEKANTYQVHRTTDRRLTIVKKGDIVISRVNTLSDQSGTIGEICHTINHLETIDSHDEWQDVYMTTNTETSYVKVPIKVYVSAAQADLMYGVETYISTGDETAKPGEMQDPCDETVNITIQKVWKDNDNRDHKRPISIIVELYQNGTLYKNDPEHSEGKYEITGDTSSNVWSITIPELPAVYEENGTYKNYTYTVKEVGSQEEYITEYTKDENGYNYVITNTHTSTLVEGDSVVIDFGLPVKVNVLANDAIQGSGTLTGVSKGVLDNIYKVLDSDVTEELNKDNKDEEGWTKGYFGRATVVDGTITYEPTTMEMDSFDQFTYSIKTKTDVTLKQGEAGTIITDDGNDCYIYSTLTVIPATAIYYEDNEGMIKYIDAGLTEEHAKYEGELLASGLKPEYGKWYTVENDQDEKKPAGNQDTDRPGILKPTAQKIEDDMDNMYGYDSNYASTDSNDTSRTKYSNGSSQFVSVTNGKTPIATFTFTGTGFDVISVTDKDTGTVRVQVEKKDSDGKFKKIRAWIVDTYYGYDVKEDENGQFTWIPDPSKGKEALYQLPVIRYNAEDDKEEGDTNFEAYGTYKVTITPMYSILFDRNKSEGVDKGYNFYLDAVRIYSPANLDKTQEIEDVYVQDGEYEPEYQEIRNIVIEAGKFEEPYTSVYIDGCPTATWENYRDVGPSHELYLAPDQGIALTLKANEIPESVRIGVKSVKTGINFKVGYAVKEDKNWIIYGAISNYCNTATDLYYDITDQCIWELQEDGTYKTKYPVTIKNTSELSSTDSILSLTYIKYTKTPKENSIINEKD